MEKWEDWRLGLALHKVSSELVSHWPWTSVAPPIMGGSTKERSWNPAKIGSLQEGWDCNSSLQTLSGRCVLTGAAPLGLVQLYETGGRWTVEGGDCNRSLQEGWDCNSSLRDLGGEIPNLQKGAETVSSLAGRHQLADFRAVAR